MRPGDGLRARNDGFTYIAMLFALAIFGIGLAAFGQSWRRNGDRDKEDELLLIGTAYMDAIGQYYRRSPGTPKLYPAQLTDLLEDKRFAGTERHLRRLYTDPIANTAQWGLVRTNDGRIAGVYSLSEKATLRKRPITVGNTVLVGERYSNWKFIYVPGAADEKPVSPAGGKRDGS